VVDVVMDKRAAPHEVTLYERDGIERGKAWITAESPAVVELERCR
jgi:hypothetical protein